MGFYPFSSISTANNSSEILASYFLWGESNRVD